MNTTAYSSGGAGDIVFQIKVMKRLGIDTLYVLDAHYNEHITIASTVGKLLHSQGISSFPILNKKVIKFKYDLDKFRDVMQHGHMIKRMLSQFNLSFDNWKTPWLENIPAKQSHDVLINLTPRYRTNSTVNWTAIIDRFIDTETTFGFIGLDSEYATFYDQYIGDKKYYFPHYKTQNLYEMAQYIQGCDALYCNQSAALAIAQGLGKKYFLEYKPGKFNCLMQTPNENILS